MEAELSEQPRVVIMTNHGTLMNGIIVSPEQFVELNKRGNGGSYPDNFNTFAAPHENEDDFVYLADVMVFTGTGNPGWVPLSHKSPGALLRVPIAEVNCCGDRA